jgi:hypothetical protein
MVSYKIPDVPPAYPPFRGTRAGLAKRVETNF